jgi:hypothetical protein
MTEIALPLLPARPTFAPFSRRITDSGLQVCCYTLALQDIPADFFADPDGTWTFDALAQAAGFEVSEGVAIGALKTAFNGHPDGAAVVTLNSEARPYVAIIECPIAYECVEAYEMAEVSAA